MSLQPILPEIDVTGVRELLDRLRQARPLGNTPLRRLAWIYEQAASSGFPESSVMIDIVLSDAIGGLISGRLLDLRQIEQISIGAPSDHLEAKAALQADFSHENTELEAWSLLYHRYVAIDLGWQMQDIATLLDMSGRNLRRRFQYGIRRLTEMISRKEADARIKNQPLWLQLKLPPRTSELVGVEEIIAEISALLQGDVGRGIMLVGPGGVGKSVLAREVAHITLDSGRFTDVAWLCLEQEISYQTLLVMMANQLGFRQVGEYDLVSLEAALRTVLDRDATLLVIDNVDYWLDVAEQVARLNQLVAPGCLLFTGRQQLPVETSIGLYKVEPLSRSAFGMLLAQTAREKRVPTAAINPEMLDVLYNELGGNPLAGRLIVGQLGTLPLDRIVANLSALQTTEGLTLFERIFGSTWESLDNDAHRVAIAISLLPVEGTYWQDVLIMSDLSAERLDKALRKLVDCSLVTANDQGPLYVMHGLARLFIEDCIQHSPFDIVYRETLHAAIERERAEPEAADDSGGPSSSTLTQTLSLLHRELETGGELHAVSELIQQLAPAVRRSGCWVTWRDILTRVEALLHDSGAYQSDFARVLLEIGVAHRWLGEFEAASEQLNNSIVVSGSVGDFTVQAEALLELGRLCETLSQPAAAYEAAQRAAAIAHRYGNIQLRQRALIQLIEVALENDRLSEAQQLSQEALDSFLDEEPDGQMLSTYGYMLLCSGDSKQACLYQQRALEDFQLEGNLPGIGRAYLRLGIAVHATGEIEQALNYLGKGLHIMEIIGDALGQARTLSNLGAIYLQHERFTDALSVWRDAIVLLRQLDDRVGVAHTWYNLAELQWQLGNQPEGRQALIEAQKIAEHLGLQLLLARIRLHPLYKN